MGGRMILAALLGGLALFVWGFLFHAVFMMDLRFKHDLRGGEAELAALVKSHAPAHGVYALPGYGALRTENSEANQEAYAQRVKEGPVGFVVVLPEGRDIAAGFPMQLLREYATSVGLALIATFLIVVAGGLSGPIARVTFCVLLALFGCLQTDVRFWNWDFFPADWTIYLLIDKVVGGVLLGIVLHLVLRKR